MQAQKEYLRIETDLTIAALQGVLHEQDARERVTTCGHKLCPLCTGALSQSQQGSHAQPTHIQPEKGSTSISPIMLEGMPCLCRARWRGQICSPIGGGLTPPFSTVSVQK